MDEHIHFAQQLLQQQFPSLNIHSKNQIVVLANNLATVVV